MELNRAVENLAVSLGAGEVGFADLSRLPTEMTRGYSRGVSIFIPLARGILREIEDEPTITYFSHYRTVNRLLDEISLRVTLFLEKGGYPSLAVPASQSLPGEDKPFQSVFSHKTAAVLTGRGFIGKSALFVHRTYGPALRLATVLTDAPLETPKVEPVSGCGPCQACRDACPALAIEGVTWTYGLEREAMYDPRACSEHMKTAFGHIGRGSVCGLCIIACPYFKKYEPCQGMIIGEGSNIV